MSFLLTDDLNEFRTVLRKLFSGSPAPRPRFDDSGNLLPSADDAVQTLRKLAELGAFSAAVSEARGGLGMGLLASIVVLEESARVLSPAPTLECLSALEVLSAAGALTEHGEKLLADALEGRSLCAVVVDGVPPLSGDVASFSGRLEMISAAETLSHLLVLSGGSRVPYVLECGAGAARFERTPTLDLVRSYSTLVAASATVHRAGDASGDPDGLDLRLRLLEAAELSGIAGRVVELTSEYVKTRTQFQRPIGSFQAIQHKLADMLVAAEQAASLVRFAGWCAENDRKQFSSAALAAKAFASEQTPRIVEQAIQAHGGIGFTFEFPLHLYLRRALVLSCTPLTAAESFRQLGRSSLARPSA